MRPLLFRDFSADSNIFTIIRLNLLFETGDFFDFIAEAKSDTKFDNPSVISNFGTNTYPTR